MAFLDFSAQLSETQPGAIRQPRAVRERSSAAALPEAPRPPHLGQGRVDERGHLHPGDEGAEGGRRQPLPPQRPLSSGAE